MGQVRDLTGERFGLLVPFAFEGTSNRRTLWRCRCDCGAELVARADMLKSGNTRSCGCLKMALATTHGHSRRAGMISPSPTYISWSAMISRCSNSEAAHYERYGGAGIAVADRWLDFTTFLADMGERPAGMTLDRIEPTGNYEPGNVRWATPKRQAQNRRSNRLLTHDGRTLSVSEWAEIVGIPRPVLQDRIRLGWVDAKVITTPYARRA